LPFTTCLGYGGTILFPGHHTGKYFLTGSIKFSFRILIVNSCGMKITVIVFQLLLLCACVSCMRKIET